MTAAAYPVPWEGGVPSYGFGPGDQSWLPQPVEYGVLAADRQRHVPGSTLELYTRLLAVRRELRIGRGALTWLDGFPEDVLAFSVTSADGSVTVLANLGDAPLPLPEGATILAASEPLESGQPLGTDETVWLQT